MTDFPLRYAHGNVLIGQSGERAALYRLDTVSYRFLPRRDKELWFGRLAQLAYSAEADFSLWRVSRAYPVERYLDEAAGMADERHSDPEAWRAYASSHRPRLLELESHLPEIYAAISIATPGTGYATGLLKSARSGTAKSGAPARDRGPQAAPRLGARRPHRGGGAAVRASRRRPFDPPRDDPQLGGCSGARPCGIAEPYRERWWQPNALVVSTGEGGRYEPLERTSFASLRPRRPRRSGDSSSRRRSAARTGAACARRASRGGLFRPARGAALRPLEALDFPIDAVLHARWIANREAVTRPPPHLDADDVYVQEAEGRH